MLKLTKCCFVLFMASGCAAAPAVSRKPVTKTNDQIFLESLHYPYRASVEQQRKIELAIKALRPGDTESKVLRMLGKPDLGEEGYIWTYVYDMDHPQSPDEPGEMLIVALGGKGEQRTAFEVMWCGKVTPPFRPGERRR